MVHWTAGFALSTPSTPSTVAAARAAAATALSQASRAASWRSGSGLVDAILGLLQTVLFLAGQGSAWSERCKAVPSRRCHCMARRHAVAMARDPERLSRQRACGRRGIRLQLAHPQGQPLRPKRVVRDRGNLGEQRASDLWRVLRNHLRRNRTLSPQRPWIGRAQSEAQTHHRPCHQRRLRRHARQIKAIRRHDTRRRRRCL